MTAIAPTSSPGPVVPVPVDPANEHLDYEGRDESGRLYELPTSSPEDEPARADNIYVQGVDVQKLRQLPTHYDVNVGTRLTPGGLQSTLSGQIGYVNTLKGEGMVVTADTALKVEQEFRTPSSEPLSVTSLALNATIGLKVKGDLQNEEAARLNLQLITMAGGTLFQPLDDSGPGGALMLTSGTLTARTHLTEHVYLHASGNGISHDSTAPAQWPPPATLPRTFSQTTFSAEAGAGWRQGPWHTQAGVLAANIRTSTRGEVNGRFKTDIAAAHASVQYKFGSSPYTLALDGTFTFHASGSPAQEPIGYQPASVKLHHPTGQLKLSAQF